MLFHLITVLHEKNNDLKSIFVYSHTSVLNIRIPLLKFNISPEGNDWDYKRM